MARPIDSSFRHGDGCGAFGTPIRGIFHFSTSRAILMIAASLVPLPLIAQLSGRGSARPDGARPDASRSIDRDWRESARDDQPDGESGGARSPSSRATRPANEGDAAIRDRRRPAAVDAGQSGMDGRGPSLPIQADAGQVWREYNLAPYTNRLASVAHPEAAVVEWILKQTGPETWHGEELAILSATRGRLRVLHRSEIQEQVAQIVERFTRPVQSQVSIRVQLVTTSDLNWRTGLVHLLKPLAYGPEGQQAWLLAPEDAALLRSRLPMDRSGGPVGQQVMAANGQETIVDFSRSVNYISGLDLAGGTYASYQPIVGRLQDGVKMSFMPLWTTDGAAVDVVVQLTTRAVQKLHHAQGAAPLGSGNQETVMQIPEAVATHFEQTLRWPTSQVLLISAGVQPGQSSRRGGFSFGVSAAELLILAEVAPPFARSATRRETATEN